MTRRVFAAGAGTVALLSAHTATAQLDSSNVPLPNVMLLLDNSGSFEFMIDGTNPEAATNNPIIVNGSPTTLYAACSPTPLSPAPGNPFGSSSPAVGSPAGSVPNRWGTAIQALTGTVMPFYSCVAMNRQAPLPNGFTNQYSLTVGGVHSNPYDYGYNLPYHRPLSYDPTTTNFCAITPNALPGASGADGVGLPTPSAAGGLATDFPANALTQSFFNFTTGQTWNGSGQPLNAAETCTFNQLNDGAIDSASSLMRFGLMTFDNDTDPGTGANLGGMSLVCANTTTSPFEGMWSYFPNWTTSTAGYIKGWPQGCATQPAFELGARNAAAPPWEGRMVGFPSATADSNTVAINNNIVQQVIGATRPFGGTPVAALLDDAEYYFWKDPSGPSTDPFVTSSNPNGGTGCRNQYIILLTDGVPNEDLRAGGSTCGCTPLASGECSGHGAGGNACPYDLPENTAGALNQGNDVYTANSGAKITTYVIGFAVSTIQNGAPIPAQCSSLVGGSPGSLTLNAVCSTAPVAAQYQACCELQNIALHGSNFQTGAFFADTPADLEAALGQVLGLIAKQVATQTLPSFAVTSSFPGASGGTESMYVASFNAANSPWSGDVVREQLVCTASMGTYTVTEQSPPVQPANGDDFVLNINSTSASARRFLTYVPPAGNNAVPTTSGLTIRPFVAHTVDSGGDNLGTFGTTGSGAEVGLAPTAIVPSIFPLTPSPGAFNLTGFSCQDPVTRAYLSASDCAGIALQFAMAQTSVSTASDPNFASSIWPQTTRCGGTSGTCSPLGGVLHSTPAVSAAPSALFRDDSYQGFSFDIQQFVSSGGVRPPVLYVATTDGLLHAFDTSVTTKTNNELWSFIPPGVLPNLIREYYDASAIILDGAPVVQDLVWERFSGTPAPASCPGSWDQCWHTMLVAGFGGGGRGYYALDVTDPRYVNFHASTPSTFPPPSAPASTGPHFQWQLASTQLPPPGGPAQQELFGGQQSGTPALANALVDTSFGGSLGAAPHEIGIAILPGGLDGPPVAGTCQRTLNKNPGSYSPVANYDISDPAFPRRTQVRQWAPSCFGANSAVAGRSVTIVRVDTGEILAVFARNPADSTPHSPDVPANLTTGALTLSSNRLIYTPFDSPMTGTPIVYPNELGADAQRVYIGDADGTLWRIDLTNPNPRLWSAAIFADAFGATSEGGATVTRMATDSQPISVRPLVALDDFGDVTVEFATGDTGSYTTTYTPPGSTTGNPVVNYVFATQENAAGTAAQVNWYLKLNNGERVSGPMVVFNETLYFATFAPANPAANACNGGIPRMWGLDFTKVAPSCPLGLTPNNVICPTPLGDGGNPRDFLAQMPPGVYTSPPDQNGNPTTGAVIPGVTVTFTPACLGASAETPAAPMLTALVGRAPTMGSPTPIGLGNLNGATMPGGAPGTLLSNLPHTRVDSWASIVE